MEDIRGLEAGIPSCCPYGCRVQRLVGVDVARGLAVLGMFAAHLGSRDNDFWTATGWLRVADGRSAATFALLAGVSAALLSGGPAPVEGLRLRRARVRIGVRAAVLLPLGLALTALDTPIAVILPGYAVMFALVTVALRWSRRVLLVAAGAFAALGPLVLQAVAAATEQDGGELPLPVGLLVGHFYPAVVWMAYLLVGVAVGRTDLRSHGLPTRFLVTGTALAVVGYGTARLAPALIDPSHTLRRALLSAHPHANTGPEVLGNVGVVLCVLGVSIVAARRVPRVVEPLAATGALALTAYCVHIAVIAVMGSGVVWDGSNLRLLGFVVVTLVVTTAWRRLVGRGPLEQLLHRVSTGVADAVVARSDPRDELPVEDREPPVLRLAPRPPGVGQDLQGDVVGKPVGDRLPGELRRDDPLGPHP